MCPMARCAFLAIREAGRSGRIVAVSDTATIGRNHGNDIGLKSKTVSRYHAVLIRDAAGMLLLNLESESGTLVNGVLAATDAPVRLNDGDTIQFGEVLARYVAPADQWMRCSC